MIGIGKNIKSEVIQLDLNELIPIVGGALTLIYLIVQLIIKLLGNLDFFKNRKNSKIQKQKEEEREKIIEVFDSVYSKKIKKDINEVLNKQNQKIDKFFKKQDEVNENIVSEITLLTKSSNDILRREIVKIYYRYLPYKKIPRFDKESLLKMVNDYFEQKGNSFIQDLYDEIKEWEVVESIEDLKE